MFKNKLNLFTIFLAALLLLSSCGSNGADGAKTKENRLVYASESEFDGLNPILEETNLDALLFRGLMRFNENNEPVTDIADSVKISEDGLTYTIKLKEGITFSSDLPTHLLNTSGPDINRKRSPSQPNILPMLRANAVL